MALAIRNEMTVEEAREIVNNNLKLFRYIAGKRYVLNTDELFQELVCLFMEEFRSWNREYSLSCFLNLLVLRAHDKVKKNVTWKQRHITNLPKKQFKDSEIYDPWNRVQIDKVKFTIALKKGLDLMTPRQRSMLMDYIYKDMNYADIGRKYNMSRQGAHDAIKVCLQYLTSLMEEFQ